MVVTEQRKRPTGARLAQVSEDLEVNLRVARRELVNAGKRATVLMDARYPGAARRHQRIMAAIAALDGGEA